MKVPDLEVIKEIPGYKVILKAVLKSQIQQLVEQISSETEEETVVLSANLSDGSISYHGSELGRLFLDSHDEFKSQYLGFCLKRLHMKSREQIQKKDGSRESTSMEYGAALPEYRTNSSEISYSSKRIDLGLRHEPYKKNRGRGNRSNFRVTPRMSPGLHDNDSSNNIINKMEPESNFYGKLGANLHVGSMDSQQSLPQVSETVVTSEAEDNQGCSASYTENSSINEHVPSIDTYSEQTQNETSNLNIGSHGTVNIKQECSTDSETDLKITGMELPQSGFIQDESLPDGMSTMLDNSRDMSYETSVAMGTSDLQSKHKEEVRTLPAERPRHHHTSYWTDESNTQYKQMEKDLTCIYCSKVLSNLANLKRHLRIHEGIYPYQCQFCDKKFSDASNAKKHGIIHYLEKQQT